MKQLQDNLAASLTKFMTDWQKLEEAVYKQAGTSGDEDNGPDAKTYEKLVDEMHTALTTVLEGESFSTEQIAQTMSCLIEALEEIDPELFVQEGDEAEDEDDDEDFDGELDEGEEEEVEEEEEK